MSSIERHLTADEARTLTDEIRATAEQLHTLLLRAYEGHAWTALGYQSWRDYAMSEFGMSQSYAYRLLDQARIVRGIEAVSPIGETPNEAQTRELAKVPAEQRPAVWAETVQRTNGKPTAAAVRETYRPPNRPPISDEDVAQLRDLEQQPVPAEPARPQPSPAVTAFLEADKGLQNARYLHQFMKTICRSDDFMEFDPEKLAALADEDLVKTIDGYLIRVREFTARFHRARRPGLRVINNGRD